MRFKRLAIGAFALVAATGMAAGKDWTTVRIGTDATYPPFELADPSGKIVGFDIEIADAMCAEMKVKCEYINQGFDGIIPALLAGKFDAIVSSISITPERLKQIDFSDKIYNTPPAIARARTPASRGRPRRTSPARRSASSRRPPMPLSRRRPIPSPRPSSIRAPTSTSSTSSTAGFRRSTTTWWCSRTG